MTTISSKLSKIVPTPTEARKLEFRVAPFDSEGFSDAALKTPYEILVGHTNKLTDDAKMELLRLDGDRDTRFDGHRKICPKCLACGLIISIKSPSGKTSLLEWFHHKAICRPTQ